MTLRAARGQVSWAVAIPFERSVTAEIVLGVELAQVLALR